MMGKWMIEADFPIPLSLSLSLSFQGHKSPITSMCFSENGYYLSTTSSDANEGVKLWDLRKLQNFHTIDVSDQASGQKFGKKPPGVFAQFDKSGAFLAVGCGKSVQVRRQHAFSTLILLFFSLSLFRSKK